MTKRNIASEGSAESFCQILQEMVADLRTERPKLPS